jgi:hypothetical protein
VNYLLLDPNIISDIGVQGTITDQGIADNLSVGLAYLESWLRGTGCVPLHNLVRVPVASLLIAPQAGGFAASLDCTHARACLVSVQMEDAATAEIARCQSESCVAFRGCSPSRCD